MQYVVIPVKCTCTDSGKCYDQAFILERMECTPDEGILEEDHRDREHGNDE